MRISDWSSDVCSSDLSFGLSVYANTLGFSGAGWSGSHSISAAAIAGKDTGMERVWDYEAKTHFDALPDPAQIGRKEIGSATCRERVCQSVSFVVVAVSLKKKHIYSTKDIIK